MFSSFQGTKTHPMLLASQEVIMSDLEGTSVTANEAVSHSENIYYKLYAIMICAISQKTTLCAFLI